MPKLLYWTSEGISSIVPYKMRKPLSAWTSLEVGLARVSTSFDARSRMFANPAHGRALGNGVQGHEIQLEYRMLSSVACRNVADLTNLASVKHVPRVHPNFAVLTQTTGYSHRYILCIQRLFALAPFPRAYSECNAALPDLPTTAEREEDCCSPSCLYF